VCVSIGCGSACDSTSRQMTGPGGSKAHSLSALPLLDAQLVDGRRDRGQPALVIERRAVGVADQLERPATEIDQRLAPSLRPIARQFVFRRHHRVRQKLQDVLARDADMRPRVRGRQRWSLDVRNVREILAQSFEHRLAQNAVPRSRR